MLPVMEMVFEGVMTVLKQNPNPECHYLLKFINV